MINAKSLVNLTYLWNLKSNKYLVHKINLTHLYSPTRWTWPCFLWYLFKSDASVSFSTVANTGQVTFYKVRGKQAMCNWSLCIQSWCKEHYTLHGSILLRVRIQDIQMWGSFALGSTSFLYFLILAWFIQGNVPLSSEILCKFWNWSVRLRY